MSFAQLNLDHNISKAILACGYTQPTPIQEHSIPAILAGKDILASAQTGSGKTAAFVLPALHHLSLQKPSKKTRILILTPTRELASQITKAASLYGKFLNFNIVSLVGGMPYHHQIKDLMRGANIIVATPGRLMDHIEQKRVDLSNIEMMVLDEADRMLDMGFIDDVQHIASLTPDNRQTLLFSATVDNKLGGVVRHLLNNPVRIDLSSETLTAPQIEQELYRASSPQHKTRMLKHLLKGNNIFKAIIFSATKINADKLATQLRDDGFEAAALHGDLKQNVRNRTIEQLRRGKIQYLVATDVAARGIDISDITHVINYDMPRFCEDYVHRIGRTGRAGKSGVAISFVLPTDTRHLQRIERYIGQRLKLTQLAMEGEQAVSFEPEVREVRRERDHFARSSDRDGGGFRGKKKSSDSGRKFGSSFERRDRDSSSRFERKDDDSSFSARKRSSDNDRPAFGDRKSRPAADKDGFRSRSREASSDDRSFSGVKRQRDDGSRFERPANKEGFRPRSREASDDGRSFNEVKRQRNDGGNRFARSSDKADFKPRARKFADDNRDRPAPSGEKFGYSPRKKAASGVEGAAPSRTIRIENKSDFAKPGAKKRSFANKEGVVARERSFKKRVAGKKSFEARG